MISCLLIGNTKDIQLYSALIAELNYFGEQKFIAVDEKNTHLSNIDSETFDALFILSPLKEISELLVKEIKLNHNIYFVDQPNISTIEIKELFKLQQESKNILFPQITELNHPLVQEFISTSGSHLLFRYNKDISSKHQVRFALLNALCFITILSPIQVKKVDVSSIEKTNDGRPAFKIRLQLFDSSIAYIIIKLENKKEHNILIESKSGNFIFNFTENYLENVHGIRFKSKEISDTDLVNKSLESFAHCIIFNKQPSFSFHHYTIVFNLLSKIENILMHSF